MKKALFLFLVTALILSLVACGGTPSKPAVNGQTPAESGSEKVPTPNAPEAEDFAIEVSSKAITYGNSIGSTWVQTIIEITNIGSKDIYLSAGSYDLEDSAGKLIESRSIVSVYPSVISPGEKGYLYEETTLDAAPEGELTVIPHVKADPAKVQNIRYNVSDVELSADEFSGIKALGRVENTTTEDDGLANVVIVLKDVNNAAIGVLFTFVDINAGDKVGFSTSGFSLPPSVTIDAIASFEAFAYPTQFQF